jgi:hypothetical protein
LRHGSPNSWVREQQWGQTTHIWAPVGRHWQRSAGRSHRPPDRRRIRISATILWSSL